MRDFFQEKLGAQSPIAEADILSGVAERRQTNRNDNIADVIMGNGPLKADTVGKSAMLPAMLEAIMRPDAQAPDSKLSRADLERLRRSLPGVVY
jgi:hypothetical protein